MWQYWPWTTWLNCHRPWIALAPLLYLYHSTDVHGQQRLLQPEQPLRSGRGRLRHQHRLHERRSQGPRLHELGEGQLPEGEPDLPGLHPPRVQCHGHLLRPGAAVQDLLRGVEARGGRAGRGDEKEMNTNVTQSVINKLHAALDISVSDYFEAGIKERVFGKLNVVSTEENCFRKN